MRKFRTLDEFEEEYFRNNPEEIDNYLTEIFQEYATPQKMMPPSAE